MREKIYANNQIKWLFKQFTIINRTAIYVYSAVQGGLEQNFYNCYCEYEDGTFGWVKESNSFCTAIQIYDLYTANDGWDIIGQLEDLFEEDLKNITAEQIAIFEKELEEIEL